MLNILKWFFMLSKRLYKKPSFLILLLLIPLCVFAFSFVAKQNSGFVNVVLSAPDDDKVSNAVIEELLNESSIISFTVADSEQEALAEVKSGLADEAWIFTENARDEINEFVGGDREKVVTVYTKEQNVTVRLAREKLTGVLYKYCARAYYLDYIRSMFSELDDKSNGELMAYFDNTSVDDSLFAFENPSNTLDKVETINYLTSPIRGLLAIFAVLCGLAATMYYKQDEASGTFSYVKNNRKCFVAFGCVLTAVINISVVLLLSLSIASLSTGFLKELVIVFLYAVSCTSFCLLLGAIFKKLNTYSAIIPLLTVVFIGICPVFIDFRSILGIQLLFPPTYYINSSYNSKYLLYMVIYSAICLVLTFVLQKLKTSRWLKK